jgi:MFS family permease
MRKSFMFSIKSLPKKSVHYGWVIVFIAALTQFFSGPGQTFSTSIFINSYIQDFGWSRSLISGIYSVATLASGFLLFIIGRLIDKHGHKTITPLIGFLLGLACLWSSFISNIYMLFLSFFMLRFFGQGSMTLLPATLVPKWFVKRRGFALSLMTLGIITSSALVPILNNFIIHTYNWRVAWRFWTMMLWLVFVPIAFIWIHNKPEDLGLLPDNQEGFPSNNSESNHSPTLINSLSIDKEEEEEEEEEEDIQREKKEISWTLQEAMRTRSFWFMMFAGAIYPMVITGLTFHFISIIMEKGFSNDFAAMLLSITAIVSFPFTFIAGFILDQLKVHLVIAFSFILNVLGLILLIQGQTHPLFILFAVITGITLGFQNVSSNVLWVNYYGQKYLGSIRSLTMSGMVLGSALGPLPFGIFYDRFGGYSQILVIMILFNLLAFLASFLSPAPKKETLANY